MQCTIQSTLLGSAMIATWLSLVMPAGAQTMDAGPVAEDAGSPAQRPDAPRWTTHGSVDTLEKRGRWLLGWGAGCLGAGVGFALSAVITGQSTRGASNQAFDGIGASAATVTQALLGSGFLVAGVIMTPLGAKRLKWTRGQKRTQVALGLRPTGLSLRANF